MAGKLQGRAISNTANIVSQTITVGNSTSNSVINSTAVATPSVNVGSNVFVNTSTIHLGNSTVNTVIHTTGFTGNGAGLHGINASSIATGTLDTARLPSTVNVSSAINVGANLNINTSTIFIGNSTVNTTIIAGNVDLQGTQLRVGNVIVNGNQLSVGNVTITDAQISVGNSTSNIVLGSAGVLSGNGSQLTSVNAIALQGNSVSDILTAANTAANTLASAAFSNAASRADSAYSNATSFASNADNISSGTLNNSRLPATVNVTSVNLTTSINVGANVTANATALKVGNSTVNTVILATGIDTDGTLAAAGLTTLTDVTITGNLTVLGNTSQGTVGTLAVGDTFIVLVANLAATNAPTSNAGITVNRGSSANVKFQWDETNDRWALGNSYVSGNLTVTGDIQIDGNLVVSGTSVVINAASLAVEDNMIYLNNGSQVTHPDLGFAGNYNDGSYKHAGFFRDASDGVWKVYDGYTLEPDASAYIDTTNNSFRIADFTANVITANSFSGNGASVTSVNAATVGGNTASTLRTYSDTVAATAFSNAALRADAAYSNATAFAANADNISSGTLNTARLPATVNVSTVINVGANVNVNTSVIQIGNSTVNTSISAATILINGVNVNTSITSNAATAYTNAIAIAANATNLTSGTVAFARLPALYVGTTQIQSSSAAQAVSGITTLATGNTTITGFANVTSTLQVQNVGSFTYNGGSAGWSNYSLEVAPSAGGAYMRVNRATSTGIECGYAWATAGACTWINFLGSGTTTLGWYQGAATVMTLTTAGLLTTNNLTTSTNTATFGTAAYVVANGNVGINTSSPAKKLQVNGDALIGTNAQRISIFDDGNAHIHSTTLPLWINCDDNAAVNINRQTSGDVVLTNAGSGKVGIGANTPAYKLQVDSVTANATADSVTIQNSGVTSVGHVSGLRFRYVTAEPAAIRAVLDNASSGTGRLGLFVSTDGTGANLTERLGIVANGNVGIGTTSPGYKLEVNGTIASTQARFTNRIAVGNGTVPFLNTGTAGVWFSNGGGSSHFFGSHDNDNSWLGMYTNSAWRAYLDGSGNWYVSGSVYASYSDIRLKDVVGNIENTLEKICSLDTIYYKANDLAKSLGVIDSNLNIGTTSQSVKKVFPELIAPSPVNREYETVQYERLVVPLIAAVKELNQLVKEQQKQIKELKAKVGL